MFLCACFLPLDMSSVLRFTVKTTGGEKFLVNNYPKPVAYPGILFRGGETNSVEDRGQRERGSAGR